ncbi:MAG: damage repair protein [Bacilli bacterium]
MKRHDRDILSIDLKSFYASVECLDRSLDPFTTPLVVADEARGDGTIVLAASPFIKEKYGVKSRCRLYEVSKDIPGLIIALPHMSHYLEVSSMINSIYLDFVSDEDLYVYSIDESFLDVTKYLKRNNDTPISYARKIIKTIRDKTGLTVTAGIGKNLFMAKACMDIEAKHSPEFLSSWNYNDIPTHLWPISPLSKVWGIGSRLEKRLNNLGFYTVGDIAVSDPEFLKKELGVIGEEIYYHSHGYDDALIQDTYISPNHSLSVGQVLLRDYHPDELPILLNDMSFEISDRMRQDKVIANNFCLFLQFKDHKGIAKRAMFYTPTDSAEKISKKLIDIYNKLEIDEDVLFRGISIVACDVISQNCYQTNLFEDFETDARIRQLENTMMTIRKKYGTIKAMPCSALSLTSTFVQRENQIGGHHR